jgi:hypothetical protein
MSFRQMTGLTRSVEESSQKRLFLHKIHLNMMMHPCNPSTWEAKTGGSQVQGQPGLHRENLTKKKERKNVQLPLAPWEILN